jgi:signal transduction histidine kinase
LRQLRWLIAVVSAIAIVAAALLQVAVVQRNMSPLNSLAYQIERVSEHDLSQRCGESSLPRELKPIAVKLNELLGRLDAAFMREKSFTSDVAHELRTPVAGMRSTLEVALSVDRSADDYRHSLSDCLSICSDMQRLTESLLALVRIESGQLVVHPEEIDVNALLLDCWQPLGAMASSRDVSVDWRPRGALYVESDRTCLKLILRNLLENAVAYVDSGGRITVESAEVADAVRLTLLNTGSQIGAADATKVFDRFWRGSLAREGTGSHAGLGLAICKRLSERLNSRITVESEQDGLFSVCLSVPRLGAAGGSVAMQSNESFALSNGKKK